MMSLLETLELELSQSDAAMRKVWANEIVDREMDLNTLLCLLHGDVGTAQRFTWLLGDVCEMNPTQIEPVLPLLFELRDQMPFPGMRRSVAKWLWLTKIPESVSEKAQAQLLEWMRDEECRVACKSFAAKALVTLVESGRLNRQTVVNVFTSESRHSNRSYARRIAKLHESLSEANSNRRRKCVKSE